MIRKRKWILLTGIAFFLICLRAQAAKPLVLVIDPGHGGENLGAQYEGYTEKDMTLVVAESMKTELEKYEGVTVYLTHDQDQDMSIKDRAVFAAEKNADFLFCLHFNSSVEHNLFGAEVWVPAGGEFYAKGRSFGLIQMEELTAMGLYSRGIKTRLNDRDENYYGILRYCTQEGVPSALIEHCHLDHDKDKPFYQQGEEQLRELGRLDATAAAKYFGLKSELLGVDYSDYPVPETQIPSGLVRPDKTEPELCYIEVTNLNQETGEATVRMEAEDGDSYILYSRYSLDNGNTFSLPEAWPRPEAWNQSAKSNSFTISLPFDERITLCAQASNGFDVWAQSNSVVIDPIPDPERLRREEAQRQEAMLREAQKNYREISYDQEEPDASSDGVWVMVVISGIAVCMLFVSFVLAKTIYLLIKGNKKR